MGRCKTDSINYFRVGEEFLGDHNDYCAPCMSENLVTLHIFFLLLFTSFVGCNGANAHEASDTPVVLHTVSLDNAATSLASKEMDEGHGMYQTFKIFVIHHSRGTSLFLFVF